MKWEHTGLVDCQSFGEDPVQRRIYSMSLLQGHLRMRKTLGAPVKSVDCCGRSFKLPPCWVKQISTARRTDANWDVYLKSEHWFSHFKTDQNLRDQSDQNLYCNGDTHTVLFVTSILLNSDLNLTDEWPRGPKWNQVMKGWVFTKYPALKYWGHTEIWLYTRQFFKLQKDPVNVGVSCKRGFMLIYM